MELQDRGSGWVAHPAITDNCIQMGPMTGVVEALTAPPGSKIDTATRVVGGLGAFCAQAFPGRGLALTAAQRAPIAADGSISTHHWLMGGGNSRVLSICDLQVCCRPALIFNRRDNVLYHCSRCVEQVPTTINFHTAAARIVAAMTLAFLL